jgi:hypothetical protein
MDKQIQIRWDPKHLPYGRIPSRHRPKPHAMQNPAHINPSILNW